MILTPSRNSQGFTLLEVLIAFMVLSFGLLGALALQGRAKQASFDAMQRAAAVELASDILHRLRSNDTEDIITHYDIDFSSDDEVNFSNTCFIQRCTPAQIAATDINMWRQAIKARENTGSLDSATVCITPSLAENSNGRGINVEVVVSWQGKQEMTAIGDNANVTCGNADSRRRLVVMNSYVLLR
ncbi:type IV pilus modification protein PilV [Pseudoalteromonas sp. T1lg65]|uniref:type IV pilus modification protein PilV n=1 Tax=Pseudoalteromonas sp. T1lg65 TaxID=2077101 RepID=UPI003F79C6F0